MPDGADPMRDYPEHYPYPLEDGQTHWEDCWRYPGHHNCAVSRIYKLQDRIELLENQMMERSSRE